MSYFIKVFEKCVKEFLYVNNDKKLLNSDFSKILPFENL